MPYGSHAVANLGPLGADGDGQVEGRGELLEGVEAGVAGAVLKETDGAVRYAGKGGDLPDAQAALLADRLELPTEIHGAPSLHRGGTLRLLPDTATNERACPQLYTRGQGSTWTNVTEEYLGDLYDTVSALRGQLAVALGVLLSLGFDMEDFVDLVN